MKRLFLALMVAMSALPANAWQIWKGGELAVERAGGRCTPETKLGECISNEVRHVRTADGTRAVRLYSRMDVSPDELNRLFSEFNTTADEVMAREIKAGFHAADAKFAFASKWIVLQGLMAEDGKTLLLPAKFKRVLPLSDEWALVLAINNQWYLASLEGKASQLKPFTTGFLSYLMRGGKTPEVPFTVILYQGGDAAKGTGTYLILGRDGSAAMTVSDVIDNPDFNLDFYTYGNGSFGFPVNPDDEEPLSVFVDGNTLALKKIGPLMELARYGQAMRYSSSDDLYPITLMKRAEMPSGHGALSTAMYVPLSYEDGELMTLPDGILGLVPYQRTAQSGTLGWWGEGIRGWLSVHGDDTRHYYKFLTHAPEDGWLGRTYTGHMDEISPSVALQYAETTWAYQPLADVWIGTLPKERVDEVFEGVPDEDRIIPQERLALRFFEDPKNPMTSEMTDWYDVGEFYEPGAINKAYENRASLPSHPDSPEALEYPLILQELQNRWKSVLEAQAYLAIDWDAVRAEEMRQAQQDLVWRADNLLIAEAYKEYRGDFYPLALQLGGKYLAAYFNHWGALPKEADAYQICRNFGNQSYECGLVNGWANSKYNQRQQRERERQQEYLSRLPKKTTGNEQYLWQNPDKWKERCYPGPEYEICFQG